MATQTTENTSKPYVWIAVLAVIGLTVVSIVAMDSGNGPITVSTDGEQDVLSVTGTHVLEVAPDQAIMMIGVVTNDTNAATASSLNKATMQRVLDAVKAQGVTDAKIETTSVYLAKNQEWNYRDQVYIDRGYQQTTMLKITVEDLSKVGSVLDAAVGAGANNVQDVSFTLKPETENRYKQQSLTDATKIATGKAKTLADAAGADLGRITSITENSYNYQPYLYNVKNVMAAGADASAPTPISPQKVSISVSVSVSYELE